MQEEKINTILTVISKKDAEQKEQFLKFLSTINTNSYYISTGLILGYDRDIVIKTALYSIDDADFCNIAIYLINSLGAAFTSLFNIDKIEIKDHNYDMVMSSKLLLDEKTIDEEIEIYQKKVDVLKFIKKQREQSDYGTIYF